VNRVEHILSCVAEECNETGQRALKAQRFGMDETQPGRDDFNWQRLMGEFHDLLGAVELLQEERPDIPWPTPNERRAAMDKKKDRIRTYMAYAVEQGTLQEETKNG
jgi:hypothetical protein